MKILNLLVTFASIFLNNIHYFIATFTGSTYTYIKALLIMDNNDGQEEQDQGRQQQQHVQQNELALQEIYAEEFGANENYMPMDMANATDSEDTSNDAQDVDDDDNDDDNDSDSDLSEYSDDDGVFPLKCVDVIGWMDTDEGEYTLCTLKRFHNYFIENRTEQIYEFKPLHLIKCNYRLPTYPCGYPTARSGHRVVASESHLYCLGGYNPHTTQRILRRESCVLFQELWAYNFAAKRWKLLLNTENADMPRELASNAMVLYNNVLISHGGTGYPFGETCSNECHVYTIGEKPEVIRLQATGDFPTAQYGPAIVIHNGYMYTIGGTTGFDYTCDVYRLNLESKTWENVYICRPDVRDDPEGRYRHEIVYDGNYVYVLGGGTSNTVYDLQRIPAFNLTTNKWEYFETFPDSTASLDYSAGFPKPRKCLSCVQYKTSNGEVEAFITGGLQGDLMTYFNDIWKINLRTKQWSKIHSASLPRPLYFHSAAHANNGCMYIFGGIEYSEKDMHRCNDLYKMWMTIPKLTEICWDAITFYNNNLYRHSRSTLLSVGIPQRFVNRLPLKSHVEQPKHLPHSVVYKMLGIE